MKPAKVRICSSFTCMALGAKGVYEAALKYFEADENGLSSCGRFVVEASMAVAELIDELKKHEPAMKVFMRKRGESIHPKRKRFCLSEKNEAIRRD